MSPSQNEMYVYEIKDGNGLRLVDTVDTGVMGDNLNIDPNTGAIYTAAMQTLNDVIGLVYFGKPTPSFVLFF